MVLYRHCRNNRTLNVYFILTKKKNNKKRPMTHNTSTNNTNATNDYDIGFAIEQ